MFCSGSGCCEVRRWCASIAKRLARETFVVGGWIFIWIRPVTVVVSLEYLLAFEYLPRQFSFCNSFGGGRRLLVICNFNVIYSTRFLFRLAVSCVLKFLRDTSGL